MKSFSTGGRLAPSMFRICKALQSGGADEKPPNVRRRLTRVTLTASAISVASSIFDVDDDTPSTVAHKTIYHSVLASYNTSHRSTSAVSHLVHSAPTSDSPPCPRPMRFQKGPLADADFYEYVDSETLEMVRVHHDNFVLRAELEEGPSGFGVANFLDEAVSCGIRWPQLGASFALRCQSCFAHELVCCHELQKLSILFFRCFQSLLFSRIWLCGETDRGSSGRGTQNHQIWIIEDVEGDLRVPTVERNCGLLLSMSCNSGRAQRHWPLSTLAAQAPQPLG